MVQQAHRQRTVGDLLVTGKTDASAVHVRSFLVIQRSRKLKMVAHRLKLLAAFGNKFRPVAPKSLDECDLGLCVFGQDMAPGRLQIDDHAFVRRSCQVAAGDSVAQRLLR